MEQIAYPRFPLRDIESIPVETLMESVDTLGIDYSNEKIGVALSAKCSRMGSTMEDSIAE